jgi:hypothetical protein
MIRKAVLLGLVMFFAPVGAAHADRIMAFMHRWAIGQHINRTARVGPARIERRGNLSVLHLYGTPQQMGRQYGTLLRSALRSLKSFVDSAIPQQRRNRFLAFGRMYEPRLPKRFRSELRAVAKASGVPYLYLVTLNVLPQMSCSGLAVSGPASGNRGVIFGRNADYFSFGLGDRGTIMVVYHAKGQRPVVAITFIGMIGAFTGINDAGVAWGNMLVFNAKSTSRNLRGLPIQLALRQAAERAKDANAMARLLVTHTPMIPINVMVADRKKAIAVELSHKGSRLRLRDGKAGIVAASNHFRSPALRAFKMGCSRYRALRKAAERNHGKVDVAMVKKALLAARVKNRNLQAVVFEPTAKRFHISANRIPAARGPYQTFELIKLLRVRPKGGKLSP